VLPTANDKCANWKKDCPHHHVGYDLQSEIQGLLCRQQGEGHRPVHQEAEISPAGGMGDVQGRDRGDRSGHRLRGIVGQGQRRIEKAQRGREGPPRDLKPRQPPHRKALLHPLRRGLLPPGVGGPAGEQKQQVGVLRQDQERGRQLSLLCHL